MWRKEAPLPLFSMKLTYPICIAVGLHILQRGTVVAHAVIDDLLDRRAQVRIVKNLTSNPVLKLGPDTRVQSVASSAAQRTLERGGLSRTDAAIAMAVKGRR